MAGSLEHGGGDIAAADAIRTIYAKAGLDVPCVIVTDDDAAFLQVRNQFSAIRGLKDEWDSRPGYLDTDDGTLVIADVGLLSFASGSLLLPVSVTALACAAGLASLAALTLRPKAMASDRMFVASIGLLCMFAGVGAASSLHAAWPDGFAGSRFPLLAALASTAWLGCQCLHAAGWWSGRVKATRSRSQAAAACVPLAVEATWDFEFVDERRVIIEYGLGNSGFFDLYWACDWVGTKSYFEEDYLGRHPEHLALVETWNGCSNLHLMESVALVQRKRPAGLETINFGPGGSSVQIQLAPATRVPDSKESRESGQPPGPVRADHDAVLEEVLGVAKYGMTRVTDPAGNLSVAEAVGKLGVRPFHSDETGNLYRIPGRAQDTRFVRVLDPAARGDDHPVRWLAVPPHVIEAREGVAWSYGLGRDAYRPTLEG